MIHELIHYRLPIMQKPILPIQISSAGAAPARAKNAQPEGGAQFNQALHREIEQRKTPPPPPKQNGPAKSQQQAQQSQHTDKAGAPKKTGSEPSKAGKEKIAAKEGATADSATQSNAAGAAEAHHPVLDMLALVASFNQLTGSVTVPAQTTDDALPAGASGAQMMDGKLVAAVAAGGLDKLAATGAALLEGATDGGAPIAQPAVFGNMMAKLDGAKSASAEQAHPTGLEKAALGKDIAVPNRPAETGQAKAMVDPAQFAQVRARDVALPEAGPKEVQVSATAGAPVQQASLAMANAANGVGAGDKIPARVGTPAWDNQVGQKIVWMVAGKEQSASLTLNPPDMGPMQVVLSVTNDHATVTFSAATPEVRQALEDAMPKLREMMSESGIALGNASVNDGSAQQQQQARDDAGGRSGRANMPGTVENTASGSAAEAEAKAAARPTRVGELPGLVDTFA